MRWEVGGRLKREGTCVNLWLIHVDAWQKSTQHCKAIIPQLKIAKLKKIKEKVKAITACRCFSLGWTHLWALWSWYPCWLSSAKGLKEGAWPVGLAQLHRWHGPHSLHHFVWPVWVSDNWIEKASFENYIENSNKLLDCTLFTVTELPKLQTGALQCSEWSLN